MPFFISLLLFRVLPRDFEWSIRDFSVNFVFFVWILVISVDIVRISCCSFVWIGEFLVRLHEISSDLR